MNGNIDEVRRKRNFSEHLANARVMFSKEDYTGASAEVQAALEIVPDDPDARELGADILAALGKKDAAAAEYKALFTEDKTRESAEEKYALIVLGQYDNEQKLKEELEHKNDRKPSAWTMVLTAIVPGVGALLKEKYAKGIILFVLWLVFFCLSCKQMGGRWTAPMRIFTSPSFIAACAVWLYSFADTLINFNKE